MREMAGLMLVRKVFNSFIFYNIDRKKEANKMRINFVTTHSSRHLSIAK